MVETEKKDNALAPEKKWIRFWMGYAGPGCENAQRPGIER